MSVFSVGLLYALLALDGAVIGPFLLSRPLVAGPLLGWWMGQPSLGFFVGGVVELLWIKAAWGQGRSLDLTLITALALFWSTAWDNRFRPLFSAALALAVPCGFLMTRLDRWIYGRMGRLFERAAEKRKELEPLLGRGLVLSAGVWFIRGLVLFVVLACAGARLGKIALDYLPEKVLHALNFVTHWLPLLGFCAAFNYFLDRELSYRRK